MNFKQEWCCGTRKREGIYPPGWRRDIEKSLHASSE